MRTGSAAIGSTADEQGIPLTAATQAGKPHAASPMAAINLLQLIV